MGDTLNSMIEFSGVDIYNGGGAAVEILNYTSPSDVSSIFTPMIQLDGLNGAAANITVEIWFKYSMSAYALFDTTGAVAKSTDAATIHLWSYKKALAYQQAIASSSAISIRVSSSNSNDTSISGKAWLLNANRGVLFESTILLTVSGVVFDITSVSSFQETTDWYKHNLLEITDADTGTSAIRRVVAQAAQRITVDSAYPFTPAASDPVKMLRLYDQVDVNTVNGATPISTGDIKTAMEVEGGMLESIDTLSAAAGDGDLAVMKTLITAIDTLTKAAGNGDLALILNLIQAFEAAPTASEIVVAMKAMTGITEGGTWTWQKALKILSAWVAGNWRVKSSDPTIQELMDAENGTTVILEQSLTRNPAAGLNYRSITVKI